MLIQVYRERGKARDYRTPKVGLIMGCISLGESLGVPQRVLVSEISFWKLTRVFGTRDSDC